MIKEQELDKLEEDAVAIINDWTVPRDVMLRRLGLLFEIYKRLKWQEHWERFYKRYLENLKQKRQRHLSVSMIEDILQEPAFRLTGELFGFMIFSMLYGLTDENVYHEELRTYRPDVVPTGPSMF